MYKGKRILAIIPARSGSKGIPNKNIQIIKGKPLMAYTIEASIHSMVFEDVILSTDSFEYGEIGKKYGAWVPFLRPEEISKDTSTTREVIIHTLNKLEEQGRIYDYFVLLQPTSPLRTWINIKEGVDLIINKDCNSLVGICEVEHSSKIIVKLNDDDSLDHSFNDLKKVRRQDFDKEYRINGALYISKVEHYLKYGTFYGEKSLPYLMDKRNSLDIDDLEGLNYVKYLIENE